VGASASQRSRAHASTPGPGLRPAPPGAHLPFAVVSLARRPHVRAEAVHHAVAPLPIVLAAVLPDASAEAVGQAALERARVARPIGRAIVVHHMVHVRAARGRDAPIRRVKAAARRAVLCVRCVRYRLPMGRPARLTACARTAAGISANDAVSDANDRS
jgi:hypothetical protein